MGQVAIAITTTTGDVLSLAMPCDCRADSLGLRVGSTVLTGEPILALSAADAAAVVQAVFPAELAFDLARGDRVELLLPDGSVVPATAALGQTDILIPTTALAPTLVGQPVQVRLIRQSGWVGAVITKLGLWFEYVSGKL